MLVDANCWPEQRGKWAYNWLVPTALDTLGPLITTLPSLADVLCLGWGKS
jgi:hypothetical protein